VQYLCLIYHDKSGPEDATRDELDALLAELRLSGQLVNIWEPQLVGTAARVSVRAGLTTVGSVASDLTACAVIEARDLNDAVRLASRFPQARGGQIDVQAMIAGIRKEQSDHEHKNSGPEAVDQV
jgi:hypothetical protein